MIVFVQLCVLFMIILGGSALCLGILEKLWVLAAVGLVCSIIGWTASVVPFSPCIPAEPIARNSAQTTFVIGPTVFNTGKEMTYTIDSLYSNGTYLLTVDGKDVLVVWQAVDGEVG